MRPAAPVHSERVCVIAQRGRATRVARHRRSPVAPVRNVNDPPAGGVELSTNAPEVGRAIRALTDSITDPDGLAAGAFRYQWQRNGGTGFRNIAGATARRFTPARAQLDERPRVVVSFTDGQDTSERLTSTRTQRVDPRR